MVSELQSKYRALTTLLEQYNRVAIAFSGGVDSTLLLYAAGQVLGKEKVLALHGVSCINSQHDIQGAKKLHKQYCSVFSRYRQIELHPLLWKEFVRNNEDRCYFCKKRIYSLFKVEVERDGGDFLLDGTNKDDLKDHRPGFRAIRELGVHTPLLEAGLNKNEIRQLVKELGLPNFDLPSNSCLATRVEENTVIHEKMLQIIDDAEQSLRERGFNGSRVRPRGKNAVIEVMGSDIERICQRATRISILHYFQIIGFEEVHLNLQGRM